MDGSTSLGSPTPLISGTASILVSNLNLGQHSLTAVYTGDTDDSSSASPAQSLTVNKAVPAISIASDINPSLGGTQILLSATLHSAANTPSGLITWTDSGAVLGAMPINANGVATLGSTSLSVGQHLITASFPGDASNGAATSSTLTQVVQIAVSSVSVTSSKSPALVGDPISYLIALGGAGGHPSGLVTLRDGSVSIGTVTVDASGHASLPLTVAGPGTHTITATFAGDPFHTGSQSSPWLQSVLQPTTTAITTSNNPAIAGRTLTLTAQVTPANGVPPTGAITFMDGQTVLGTAPLNSSGAATFSSGTLSVSQHPLSATYSGDAASQPSTSATLVETVNDASTTVTLASSGTPSTYAAPITLTAQVTGQGPTPTGTVTFEDGPAVLGQATLSASGVAALTTGTLSPGPHILTAIYTGDSRDLPSTSPALPQLVQQRTAVSIASNVNPVLTAAPLTLTVSVTNTGIGIPTGTVTLVDGSATIGTAPLTGSGVATFTTASLSAGTHSLIASYSGDNQNFNSGSAAFAQIIQLRASSTSLTTSLSTATSGEIVTLIAVVQGVGPAAPTGPVLFTSNGQTVGTATLNASGVATLNLTPTAGAYNAVAIYQGDALYATSTSPVSTLDVQTASHFTLTVNPASLSLQTMQHQTVQLTITSVKEFQDSLALGCAGLPFAATCTFSKDQIALQSDGSAIVSVVVDTGTPLTSGGQAQASLSPRHQSSIALAVIPLGALASLLLLRARSRSPLGGLPAILLLAAAAAGAIGCGSISINGTPPGQYTLTVTATGANTGVTVSQPMPLTVTK